MSNKKTIIEELKEMSQFEDSVFDFNGDGFLELEKRLERNESYVRYVLFIAHSLLGKGQKSISIKDMSYHTQKDIGYVQKITDHFLNQNILIKVKSHRKNVYVLNSNEENLRAFLALLKKAREIKKL